MTALFIAENEIKVSSGGKMRAGLFVHSLIPLSEETIASPARYSVLEVGTTASVARLAQLTSLPGQIQNKPKTHPSCDLIHRVALRVLLGVCNSVKTSEFPSFPLRYHPD